MKRIFEEIQHGNFSNFDLLTESQQIECMESWDHNMRIKYLSRNPAMTSEEFFSELDKMIEDEDEQ